MNVKAGRYTPKYLLAAVATRLGVQRDPCYYSACAAPRNGGAEANDVMQLLLRLGVLLVDACVTDRLALFAGTVADHVSQELRSAQSRSPHARFVHVPLSLGCPEYLNTLPRHPPAAAYYGQTDGRRQHLGADNTRLRKLSESSAIVTPYHSRR